MPQPYPAELTDRNSQTYPEWAFFISLLGRISVQVRVSRPN